MLRGKEESAASGSASGFLENDQAVRYQGRSDVIESWG